MWKSTGSIENGPTIDLHPNISYRITASCLLLAGSLLSSSSAHAQFEGLVVFGDSLSDVGNLQRVTLGLQPGSDYYNGRFSNGPVYSELLAEQLGFAPLVPSTEGGTNHAFGGARAGSTPLLEGGFLIRDLDDQVDSFLEDESPTPNDLHVVFAGSNDFVLGDEDNPVRPANRILTQIERLLDAGVTQLLSINVPLLGETPRYQNQRELLNNRTRSFNETLANGLAEFEVEHPDATFYQLDAASLFETLISLPEAFGFTNIHSPGIDVDDASGYLFWDEVHPTTEAHVLLSRAARRLFDEEPLLGDFNLNSDVDPFDLNLLGVAISTGEYDASFDLDNDAMLSVEDINWLLETQGTINGDANLDGRVNFSDFLKLSRNFGEDGLWSEGDFDANGTIAFSDFLLFARNVGFSAETMAAQTNQSVPEPAGSHATSIILLLCDCLRKRGRRSCSRRSLMPPAQDYRR